MAGSLLSGKDTTGWMGILLQASVRAVLLLVFTAVLCLVLRRASAAARHFIWSLAVGSVLCLPLLLLVLPSWQVRGMPRELFANTTTLPRPVLPPLSVNDLNADFRPGAIPAAVGDSGPASPIRTPIAARQIRASRPAHFHLTWPTAVLLVWGAGALAMLLYTLLGAVSIAYLRRRSRPIADALWQKVVKDASDQLHLHRSVQLFRSHRETMPMIWGWLRPVLLLPASANDWPAERKRLVILHELAHAKRADCFTQFLGQLACVLYWFNPLAWMALYRLRREREQACDDLVLESGFRGSEYAAHLLSIAKTLRSPAGAQVVAVAMARKVGLETRIRALLDPRRNRRCVTRPIATLAIFTAAAALVILSSARNANAQAALHKNVGDRQAWQPKIVEGYDTDRRLEQRVKIEIVGRAAVPALEMLARKTGVSLRVAPEDLGTVGERKLTVLARGITLKTIMMDIPQALQECHWDIDETKGKPVYLLHRNSGVDYTEKWLKEQEKRALREEGRPARESRLAAALKALDMSSQELNELEKADLYLARSLRNPRSRLMLELFLTLPEDKMEEFLDTGMTAMPYATAPEHFRQAADRLLQSLREEAMAKPKGALSRDLLLQIVDVVQADLAHATIQYEDEDGGSDLRIFAFDKKGERYSWGVEPALWPQYPSTPVIEYWYRPLFLGSGTTDEKAADKLAQQWGEISATHRQKVAEAKRKAEWPEPKDKELQRMIKLEAKGDLQFADIEQLIAKESGFSVISDHFTDHGLPLPDEARTEMPLWRVLYTVGDRYQYQWKKAGSCLIFRHKRWYELAPGELPESFINAYRDKVKRRGRLTLDDVVAAAVALAGRPPLHSFAVPRDLQEAGLNEITISSAGPRDGTGRIFDSNALLLYASLSPEQRVKAYSASGLAYQDMSPRQCALVRERASRMQGNLPPEQIDLAVFRIKKSIWNIGSKSLQRYDLVFQFPSRVDEHVVLLGLPASSGKPSSAPSK